MKVALWKSVVLLAILANFFDIVFLPDVAKIITNHFLAVALSREVWYLYIALCLGISMYLWRRCHIVSEVAKVIAKSKGIVLLLSLAVGVAVLYLGPRLMNTPNVYAILLLLYRVSYVILLLIVGLKVSRRIKAGGAASEQL